MKRMLFPLLTLALVAGCRPGGSGDTVKPTAEDQARTLAEARKGFTTRIVRTDGSRDPVPAPPEELFQKVQYNSPPGNLWAYLTPNPKRGKKHPAIIWITGGDCNSIGVVWGPPRADNEQTASAYRKVEIIMMFPSLRGGNDNPGAKEGFFGEVDDVLAAFDFLAQQPYVDPTRIYLGGHSTGGTLVLLVAESSDKFRAVFSFGPVSEVSGYGREYCPFDMSNRRELELRAPGRWLHAIKSPTFVFEGTSQGNLDELQAMANATTNPKVKFYPVQGANHFSLLGPLNRKLADKILLDTGPTCNINVTEEEVNKLMGR